MSLPFQPNNSLKAKKAVSSLIILFFLSVLLPQGAAARSKTEKNGDLLMVAIPAAGFGAAVILKDREGVGQFSRSFLLNLGITYSLKTLINKQRPDSSGDDSFPSGHTSVSFEGASFIQTRYGWKYGLPAYAAASYVAWTRVEADRHDGVDVLAGAAIGIISSRIFTMPRKGFKAVPKVRKNSFGVIVSWVW